MYEQQEVIMDNGTYKHHSYGYMYKYNRAMSVFSKTKLSETLFLFF